MNAPQKYPSRTAGFTLIELLTVIAIIAILAAILIPTLSNYRERAKYVQATSDVRNIAMAWKVYYNDHRGWPNQIDFVGGDQENTKSFEESDGEVFWNAYVRLLTGRFDEGEQPYAQFNPSRELYLNIPDRSIQDIGWGDEFVDPWGNPYKFKLDTTTTTNSEGQRVDTLRTGDRRIGRFRYDEFGSPDSPGPDQIVIEDIAIAWSRGANGWDHHPDYTEEDPKSW